MQPIEVAVFMGNCIEPESKAKDIDGNLIKGVEIFHSGNFRVGHANASFVGGDGDGDGDGALLQTCPGPTQLLLALHHASPAPDKHP